VKQEIYTGYFSKILLFGEYTLMYGSDALVIPLKKFSGILKPGNEKGKDQVRSNQDLKKFHTYLEKQRDSFPDGLNINLEQFGDDIEKGLFLESSVPQGYGAGSSGVVVAAVYGAYAETNASVPDLALLKKHFGFMESYFHGRSSGLDPLCSYTGLPLLSQANSSIHRVNFPAAGFDYPNDMFLLDSEQFSDTGELVKSFNEKMKDTEFREVIQSTMIPLNNQCISAVIEGRIRDFRESLRQLSDLQLEYFAEMVPYGFRKLWRNGCRSGDYFLKICGSGGGGFVLGFTSDIYEADIYFKGQNIRLVPVNNKI
jgi:mevalonate kinase